MNGVVTRINSFIETLNAALALLPGWATGEGGVRIGILDPVELGRIGDPFEGAATAGPDPPPPLTSSVGSGPDLLRARGQNCAPIGGHFCTPIDKIARTLIAGREQDGLSALRHHLSFTPDHAAAILREGLVRVYNTRR